MNNARRYNKPYLPIHKNAIKLLETLEPLFQTLERELDDLLSSTSTRELLAPRLLLEEGVRDGEDVEMDEVVQEEGRVVVEELERVWFNSNGETAEGIRERREDKIRKEREEVERKVREEEERVRIVEEEKTRVEEEKLKNERLEKEKEEKEQEAKKKASTVGKGKKRNVEIAELEDKIEEGTGEAEKKSEERSDRGRFKKGNPGPVAKKAKVEEPRIEEVTKLEVEDVSSRDTFKLFETG